jgi:uncharacterized protein with HEPN domain
MTPSKTEQQQLQLDAYRTAQQLLCEAMEELLTTQPRGHSTISWEEYKAARHNYLILWDRLNTLIVSLGKSIKQLSKELAEDPE